MNLTGETVTMIQHKTFTTGGYVLHRVSVPTISGHCSAWFDASGKLLDAEHFDRKFKRRSVRKNGPTWNELQTVGLRYVGVPMPALQG